MYTMYLCTRWVYRAYGDDGMDDDDHKPKVTVREGVPGEDGNVVAKVSNVAANAVGKLGNVFGKGIGGLSGKLPGSWF